MSDYKTKSSFNLANQIELKSKNSNIDRDYGPYRNVPLNKIAELLSATLQIGKTIGIIEGDLIKEYWWQCLNPGEISLNYGFVPKTADIPSITEEDITDLFSGEEE